MLVRLLIGVMVALIIAHLFFVYIKYYQPSYYRNFFRLFDVDRELSYPTLFSTFLFLLNASLFLAVWHSEQGRPRRQIWLLLAGIFTFLMFDEFGGIHEITASYVDHFLGDLGVSNIAWVFLYGALVLILGVLIGRWYLNLEPDLRKRLFFSGAVYLTGAIGVELIEGYHQRQMNMQEDLTRQLLCTVEESFEMSGLILLAWTLLRYLKERLGGYTIRI
jgi:hypothetical protein